MGTLSPSDNVDAIHPLAKAIAREVVRELTAEKKSLTLETQSVESVLTVGPVVVDVERHEATIHGRLMDLKPTEFALLAAIARNAGKVLSRTAAPSCVARRRF